MAKLPSEISNRQVIQLLRTTGDNKHVSDVLPASAASGEIAIQLSEQASATSLWTLSKNGDKAVQFVNKEQVADMIKNGAVAEVDKIETAVGLAEDGSYITKSGTHYLDSAATVEEEIDALDKALNGVQSQIDGMDKSAEAVAGQVVTTISQADGKVSEVKANVKDLQLGGYEKTTATGAIEGTDTINVALSKLENKANTITISNADGSINVTPSATGTDINVKIKSDEKVIRKDGNGGLYTDIKITGATEAELGVLGANVKEAYKLLDSKGGQLGEWIKIYKDSALKEVYLGHVDDRLADDSSPVVTSGTGETALCFIYYTVDGKYQLVAVNVESFLQESEFKDGLLVDNHKVKVKIDSTSESFLTVGEQGVKLSGVQGAIDAEKDRAKSAENALDSVVGSVKDASSESRTYGHDSTNYLNDNTTIKADVESVDSLLGKVEGEPASSADTVFSSTNTVAKNISDIKRDLAAFKSKLTLSGEENAYAKVTVVTAETGTTIEVSAKTQSIATSTAEKQGLADAYDVKTFAVNGVSGESAAATSGVRVTEVGGNKVLDFSGLKIDCGEF